MSTANGPTKDGWQSAVRAGDCDFFGHANNAIYTDYIVSATLAAWGADKSAGRWRLSTIAMDFKSPVSCGDMIEVVSWPAGTRDRDFLCGYRIEKCDDRALIAEALAGWDVPAEVSASDWPTDPRAGDQELRSTPREPNRPEAHIYRTLRTVQPYEADHTGSVNPIWIFRWGWASMFASTAAAGWPPERWEHAGFVTYQFHRDAELRSQIRPGDVVEVQSRLYDVHRVRATWEHTVVRDGEIMAIDRADGAFLNSQGKIAAAPVGMMESIVAGHDTV